MSGFGPFVLDLEHPPVVIAEVGVNHNGERDLGLRHLREAAAAGARAVKFQSFHASDVAAVGCFAIHEYWTDIGELADLARAAREIASRRESGRPI